MASQTSQPISACTVGALRTPVAAAVMPRMSGIVIAAMIIGTGGMRA